jgi:hypothetical protein
VQIKAEVKMKCKLSVSSQPSVNFSNKELSDMAEKTVTLGKYRHYKSGDLYKVIGTTLHTETLEELVV